MAHNRSPGKIRSDVLQSPLGSFHGWRLELECQPGTCPTGRYHRVNRLLQHYPGCTVGQVIGRLRCVTCGRGPTAVVLAEDRPGRRVPLTGPECGY